MKTYIVLSPIEIGGVIYHAGREIDLSDLEAAPYKHCLKVKEIKNADDSHS